MVRTEWINLSSSRKQVIKKRKLTLLNDKLKHTSLRMRKSFALIGASALIPSLVAPTIQTKAAEVSVKGQTAQHQNPFLNSIIPAASKIADKNDLYASVMMAQAILESGWGQSTLAKSPNHNLFGIKGDYQGETVAMDTLEDSGNQNYYQINAEFRKYPSYSESLEDYAALIRGGTNWDPSYYNGAWKSNTQSYQDATQHLTGRYATDTAYATKLNAIIQTHGLTNYDTPSSPSNQTGTKPVTTVPGASYSVKAGDTLYKIANMHGISVVQLMEWNQLNSSNIYVGTTLKVNATVPVSVEKPTPTTPAPSANSVYTVKSGDSLWRISQTHGVTVAQIKAWNNLKSDFIAPGQVLKVATTSTQPKPSPTPTPGVTQTQGTYTVKNGDTLYKIANELGVSVASIKTLNNLRTDMIYPGQKLLTNKTITVVETPEKVEKETTTTQTYTVKNGDSLFAIASRLGTSVANLKAVNNLKSDMIHPGQKLVTTQVSATKPQETVSRPVQSAPTTNANTYTVKNGDTLYKIASQLGITLAQLKEVNQLKSDIIYPGQILTGQKAATVVQTPVTTPVVTAPATTGNYTVKAGDTLYKIATTVGVTVAQVKSWNNLPSDIIFVGQTLHLKASETAKETSKPENVTTGYTVKSGDTLYSIARVNGVSVTQLLEWNNTTSDTIYPGQTLRVK